MRTDFDRALAVIQAAMQFDWAWTIDDLPVFAQRVGWHVADLGGRPPTVTTNLDVNRTDALAFIDHNARPGTPKNMHRIWFYFSDVVLDDPSVKPLMDNAFDELAERVRRLMVQPPKVLWERGPNRMVRWDLLNLVLKLTVSDAAGEVALVNPWFQAQDDEFDRMLESQNNPE